MKYRSLAHLRCLEFIHPVLGHLGRERFKPFGVDHREYLDHAKDRVFVLVVRARQGHDGCLDKPHLHRQIERVVVVRRLLVYLGRKMRNVSYQPLPTQEQYYRIQSSTSTTDLIYHVVPGLDYVLKVIICLKGHLQIQAYRWIE